jgi:MORN repeat variant
MKIAGGTFFIILAILLLCSCGNGSEKKGQSARHYASSSDTGFTGIKRYTSSNLISIETTLKNGVKEGLTKTYYLSGSLAHTAWYKNGLKEDSAKWYYEEGQLFRSTPYRRDTMDGIQMQYFRNGILKAKIGYKKGLRTFFIQEFDLNGRLVRGYPQLVVKINDHYGTADMYRITLGLSDQSASAEYYRGDFGSGVFDTTRSVRIKTMNGIATLDLERTGTPRSDSLDVLAVIRTPYGNNYLVHKKIGLH